MAAETDVKNKQLKQIEKLTVEQLVNGIRIWMGDNNEGSAYTLEKTNHTDDQTKKE